MIDRHRIMSLLRQRGPMSLRELAKAHGRTKTAPLAEAMAALAADGMVSSERMQPASGPAKTVWKVTSPPVSPVASPAEAVAQVAPPTPTPEVTPVVEPPAPAVEPPTATGRGNGRTHADPLTPARRRAVELLAVGTSQAAVARELGKGAATIWSWVNKDAVFRRELQATADRLRGDFERRAIAVGQNAWTIVDRMVRSPDATVSEAGARIAIAAGVRLSSRYREVQVDPGAPIVPLVIFPPGTLMPWAGPLLPTGPGPVDVAARVISDEGIDDEQDEDDSDSDTD